MTKRKLSHVHNDADDSSSEDENDQTAEQLVAKQKERQKKRRSKASLEKILHSHAKISLLCLFFSTNKWCASSKKMVPASQTTLFGSGGIATYVNQPLHRSARFLSTGLQRLQYLPRHPLQQLNVFLATLKGMRVIRGSQDCLLIFKWPRSYVHM